MRGAAARARVNRTGYEDSFLRGGAAGRAHSASTAAVGAELGLRARSRVVDLHHPSEVILVRRASDLRSVEAKC